MKLKLNIQKLEEIMRAFYTLTGIRFVIFDSDYNEILAYPEVPCEFCAKLRSNPTLREKCRMSDICAFEKCRKSKEVLIYKCHAGLVETCTPIKNEDKILGYVIFGQIADTKDKDELKSITSKSAPQCPTDGINYNSESEILAAAKLLEMCTDYLLLKEIIEADTEKIITDVKEYISLHLGQDIKTSDLCTLANVTRTKLYEIFSRECGMGIARYIKTERLKKARHLLKTTSLSITEISDSTGFADYNYFSRVFKEYFGVSPSKFRKK